MIAIACLLGRLVSRRSVFLVDSFDASDTDRTTMQLRAQPASDTQEGSCLRLLCRRDGLGPGFTLSNDLAIFNATECAVCSSFLSAMTQAPQMGNVIAIATPQQAEDKVNLLVDYLKSCDESSP
jgi:hypothetical protein